MDRKTVPGGSAAGRSPSRLATQRHLQTLLREPRELILEIPTQVGAPVLERDGDRSAMWGTLLERHDGHELVWSSRLCGADAAVGTVRIRVDPNGAGSTVTMSQAAIGAFDHQLDSDVAAGWRAKLDDLQAHLVAVPSG